MKDLIAEYEEDRNRDLKDYEPEQKGYIPVAGGLYTYGLRNVLKKNSFHLTNKKIVR